MDNHINPIKQNVRVKQFVGWYITLFFPFAAVGIINITKIPLLAALVYWVVCGIILRYCMDKSFPYLHPQFGKVKKEIVSLILATALASYFYIRGYRGHSVLSSAIIINILVYAVLSGIFEQLVWINIMDLVGAKFKMLGFVASFIYAVLINYFFLGKFVPMPIGYGTAFLFSEVLIFLISLTIYIKTQDLTIWSIQHVIYNVVIVISSGFGINALLHL